MINSTRLFFLPRPIFLVSLRPRASMRDPSTPCPTKKALTASARAFEISSPFGPPLEVCPVKTMLTSWVLGQRLRHHRQGAARFGGHLGALELNALEPALELRQITRELVWTAVRVFDAVDVFSLVRTFVVLVGNAIAVRIRAPVRTG